MDPRTAQVFSQIAGIVQDSDTSNVNTTTRKTRSALAAEDLYTGLALLARAGVITPATCTAPNHSVQPDGAQFTAWFSKARRDFYALVRDVAEALLDGPPISSSERLAQTTGHEELLVQYALIFLQARECAVVVRGFVPGRLSMVIGKPSPLRVWVRLTALC